MSKDTDAVLRALVGTPAHLQRLSRGASDALLASRPSANEWSATEIVNHLRANADIWGATIRKMLDEDDPAIRYVSPRSALKRPEYSKCGFKEALRLFSAERKKLISTLKSLRSDGWSRGAKFSGVSKRRSSETVLDYARHIANHEAAHLGQFEALFT